MKHPHSKHYIHHPDPRIPHAPLGWCDDGKPAEINLTVGDMHVSNLQTNICGWQSGTETDSYSVFLFRSPVCASRTCRTCIIC
jgi:hypothetical protein